jgi:hypothetical protein
VCEDDLTNCVYSVLMLSLRKNEVYNFAHFEKDVIFWRKGYPSSISYFSTGRKRLIRLKSSFCDPQLTLYQMMSNKGLKKNFTWILSCSQLAKSWISFLFLTKKPFSISQYLLNYIQMVARLKHMFLKFFIFYISIITQGIPKVRRVLSKTLQRSYQSCELRVSQFCQEMFSKFFPNNNWLKESWSWLQHSMPWLWVVWFIKFLS